MESVWNITRVTLEQGASQEPTTCRHGASTWPPGLSIALAFQPGGAEFHLPFMGLRRYYAR
jgi:hypothetical protein